MPTAAVVITTIIIVLFDICVSSQGSSGRGSPGPGVNPVGQLCDCVYPGDEHCLHLLYLFFSSPPRGSQPLPARPLCIKHNVCVCVRAYVCLHMLGMYAIIVHMRVCCTANAK